MHRVWHVLALFRAADVSPCELLQVRSDDEELIGVHEVISSGLGVETLPCNEEKAGSMSSLTRITSVSASSGTCSQVVIIWRTVAPAC